MSRAGAAARQRPCRQRVHLIGPRVLLVARWPSASACLTYRNINKAKAVERVSRDACAWRARGVTRETRESEFQRDRGAPPSRASGDGSSGRAAATLSYFSF